LRGEWLAVTYRCMGRKVLVLIAASMMALMLALAITSGYVLSVYSFYDELTVPRELKDRVIIVSGISLAPFTSVVKVSAVSSAVRGSPAVQDVTYQVIVPALLNGSGVIVRGIEPDFLRRYFCCDVIEGSNMCEDCLACAWVGSSLARSMKLRAGDVVTIYSIFSKSPYILEIKGVLKVPEPYDHELLVPYTLAQLLRGVSRDYASVAIVILRREASSREVLSRLVGAGEGEAPELFERVFVALKYAGREVRAEAFKHAADILIERIGMPRSSLVAIAMSLALISSVGCYVIGLVPSILSRERLSVLHEQGLSETKIRVSILLFGVVAATLGYITVKACLPVLSTLLSIPILHHPVSLGSDPVLDAGVPAFVLLFYSIGVLAADVS